MQAFLSLQRVGTTPHCSAWLSHRGDFSCHGARTPGTQAQWLWYKDLVALQHVGSSQTRDQTCVPCIGWWVLYHWATREVLFIPLKENNL